MSYDFWVEDGNGLSLSEGTNHTTNTCAMWDMAVRNTCVTYQRLRGFAGHRCESVAPILRDIYEWMRDNKEKMIHLEPKNGWGTYDSATRFMLDIVEMCENCPEGFLRMSC